ncbi:hypothetical protein [Nostoc sp.]|uniref:hypothetical protein n=1 Tax=Nostoc sp. TaxID=1180 RepID=UPI002FF829AE
MRHLSLGSNTVPPTPPTLKSLINNGFAVILVPFGLVLRQTDGYSDNLNNMRSRIKHISNKNRNYCVADKI